MLYRQAGSRDSATSVYQIFGEALFPLVLQPRTKRYTIVSMHQLFGLVNTLLENSRKTAEKDLSIQRYDVIPLSPNSGLIEWVPNCDTLHQLIREYRDARKVCSTLYLVVLERLVYLSN